MATTGFNGRGGVTKSLSKRLQGISYPENVQHLLLDVNDDVIIAWNKKEGFLLAQIIADDNFVIQVLTLTKIPVWDVHRVIINDCGTLVLLVGNRGVAAVEIPRRWGQHLLFEDGRATITCRVDFIAERLYSSQPKLKVICAAWHPGSVESNNIVTLSSDNFLRIYSTSSLDQHEQAIAVGSPRAGIIGPSTSTTLGENAISFDFSQPLEAAKNTSGNPVSNLFLSSTIDADELRRKNLLELLWPVFILYENGEVFYTVTILGPQRLSKKVLHGPLSMLPASDDNYGIDYCSLLVLQCSPPLLVIANNNGLMHHCIVLTNESEESLSILVEEPLGHQTSLMSAAVNLFVYETVELELTLCPVDEEVSAPLVLQRDPTTPTRYCVSHEAGVHLITVPLVDQFLQHCELSEDENFIGCDNQSFVEHLVCTKALLSSENVPVVGLTMSTSPPFIYTLLASGAILRINLPAAYIPPIKSSLGLGDEEIIHKKHQDSTESFEAHIRSMLLRSASQPILVLDSHPSLAPQEYMDILSRAVDTLMNGYLYPQQTVQDNIERRSTQLREKNKEIKKELEELQSLKGSLTSKAHELAERYEEANEKQQKLQERLEYVNIHLVRGLPTLTNEELKMLQELNTVKDKIATCNSMLQQIKIRQSWQASQMEKDQSSDTKSNIVVQIPDSQMQTLRSSLIIEGEKIENLFQKVNQVTKEIQK